jgi:hypothetical protein
VVHDICVRNRGAIFLREGGFFLHVIPPGVRPHPSPIFWWKGGGEAGKGGECLLDVDV